MIDPLSDEFESFCDLFFPVSASLLALIAFQHSSYEKWNIVIKIDEQILLGWNEQPQESQSGSFGDIFGEEVFDIDEDFVLSE